MSRELSHARRLERAGDFCTAECFYDHLFSSGRATEPDCVDYVVFLWNCTDFGFLSAHRLSDAFVGHVGSRIRPVLAEARRRFPNSTNLGFWDRYLAWYYEDVDLSVGECELMLEADPLAHDPALGAYSWSTGSAGRDRAILLLQTLPERGALLAGYIAAVLEGVALRAGDPDLATLARLSRLSATTG